MNLLDSIKQGLIALLLIPVFFACEQDSEPLELEIDNAVEAKFEEYSLPVKTIYIDSLRTDNEPSVAIGGYDHPRWGSITAKSFHEITYESGRTIPDTLDFVSMALFAEIEGKLLPDGPVEGEIYVYELEEEIISSVVYLSNMEIPVSGLPVDTIDASFLNSSDSVEAVSLENLGRDLFELLQDSSNLSGFRKRYAFVPSENMNSLFTFNTTADTTELRLTTTSGDSLFFETIFTLNAEHFTNITRDRSGSEIAGINNLDTLALDPDEASIAPLFGLYALADLGSFNQFIASANNILINKTEIEVRGGTEISDPLEQVRYYFYKPDFGYSGEGLLGDFDDWINTAILVNDGYFNTRPPSRPIKSTYSQENGYQSDITIFSDLAFNIYQDENDFLTERIVITPDLFLSSGSIRVMERPLLRVYYTEIKN